MQIYRCNQATLLLWYVNTLVRAGRKNAPGTARVLLEDLFSGTGRPKSARLTVVLMDEIDMLATRDQSVLYNLFGWPLNPGAKLAIIGIANTLDLPERLLPRIARCAAGTNLWLFAWLCTAQLTGWSRSTALAGAQS
jgi:hypothetical protein